MNVTFEGHAYIGKYTTLDDFLAGRDSPSILRHKTEDLPGYTYLGPVTVTTECRSTDEIVVAQITNLQKELQTVRAKSQAAENAILDQISKLQALTFEQA